MDHQFYYRHKYVFLKQLALDSEKCIQENLAAITTEGIWHLGRYLFQGWRMIASIARELGVDISQIIWRNEGRA